MARRSLYRRRTYRPTNRKSLYRRRTSYGKRRVAALPYRRRVYRRRSTMGSKMRLRKFGTITRITPRNFDTGDRRLVKTKYTFYGSLVVGDDDPPNTVFGDYFAVNGNWMTAEELAATPQFGDIRSDYQEVRIASTRVAVTFDKSDTAYNGFTQVGISLGLANQDAPSFTPFNGVNNPGDLPRTTSRQLGNVYDKSMVKVYAQGRLTDATGFATIRTAREDILQTGGMNNPPLQYFRFFCWAYDPLQAEEAIGYTLKFKCTVYRTIEFTKRNIQLA